MALLAPRTQDSGISPDGKVGGEPIVVDDTPSSQDNSTGQDQTQNQNDNQNTDNVDPADFSFDAFKAAKSLEATPAPKDDKAKGGDTIVTDDQKAADDAAKAKVEPTKVDTQEDLDKPQPQAKVAPKADKTDNRDFTGIPIELVPHFKRMGNDAYNTLKPIFLKQQEEIAARDGKIKDLQVGKIPDSYYEHERAYVLTPEFESALHSNNEAQLVYKHWEEQLNNVREGAKTYRTIVRNDKGQLAYGQELPADARAETQLMSLFTGAHNQLMTMGGKLQAVQESFKGNYSNAKQWVEDISDNTFSAFKDEKGPMAIAAKEYVNKTLPSVFRNNPLAGVLARSLVTNAEMYKLLLAAKKHMDENGGMGKGKAAAKVASTRQPTNSDINNYGGSKGASDSEVTMDMFNAVKGA